jgi:hypothetical protein
MNARRLLMRKLENGYHFQLSNEMHKTAFIPGQEFSVKTPNKACSGRRGVCALYRHFPDFKFFLLSGFYLPPPLVRR